MEFDRATPKNEFYAEAAMPAEKLDEIVSLRSKDLIPFHECLGAAGRGKSRDRVSQIKVDREMLETFRGVARPHQLDHMGHMNVQWYTAMFDDATWHLFSAIGLTSSYFRDENRGMAALEQTTKYLAEILAGNLLVCRSEVLEVKDKTIRFMHHLYDAEKQQLAATSVLVAAHLDRDKRKACPLPEFARRQSEAQFGGGREDAS